jgi:hypothetical protein
MAASSDLRENPFDLIERGLAALPGYVARLRDADLGPVVIKTREIADRNEAVSAEAVRRFEKSGAWAADGALNMVAWLCTNGKLSGSAAMERISIARQLEQLPETAQAFQRGDLGYQHVAIMARTAEYVGTAAVRQAESTLLQAAQTHDPGQFVGIAKEFECQTDQAAVLAEANRAYSRRYLHLSEPANGLVRLDGLLDAEGAATVKTAIEALMSVPARDDERTAGQRRADALVEWHGGRSMAASWAAPGGSGPTC